MTDLPKSTQAIVDAIVKKGGKRENLGDTKVCVVHFKGKNLYFMNDITPAVPLIYGIFATREEYIKPILKEANIPFKKKPITKDAFKVLVNNNGYICILSNSADVTKSASSSVNKLADKVLGAFPGAAYISFELIDDAVCNISFSLEDHIGFMLHKGKQTKSVIEVITGQICTLGV